MKNKEYNKGYNSAKEAISKGEDVLKLLNQCRSSLTCDDFDRGWKDACKKY